jgi:spermidine synthase
MIEVWLPWIELGRAQLPGGHELMLRERGGSFEIRCDGRELMSTRAHGSEETMGRLACERLSGSDAAHVLIGGLGLGYTLRAALNALPTEAAVLVAELVSEVVDWNRGPIAYVAGRPLEDRRVEVYRGDVCGVLRTAQACFDAILLDVDNGPDSPTRSSNTWLYAREGLASIKRALRSGGVLAVWSSEPSAEFEARLRQAGFLAERIDVPAVDGAIGPMHTIFLSKI